MTGHSPAITKNWVRHRPTDWAKYILPLQDTFPAIRLLEIGVFEGLSACWWLDNLLTRSGDSYLGIDPWEPHRDLGGAGDTKAKMDAVKQRATDNLAPYGDKATLFHGASVDAFRPAPELENALVPESFQVAYVDGDHHPASAAFDSINAWELVCPGGVIVWDDWYYPPHKCRYPLKTFLAGFFRLISGRYEVLWEGFQLGIRKRQ